MNIFKNFFKDLGDLSRSEFARKYVVQSVAIFMTWGAFGNFYNFGLSEKELLEKKGVVDNISIQLQVGTTQYQNKEYYPLIISLENSTEKFRVRDNFNSYFSDIRDKIKKGDTVTILTRTKVESFLCWGKNGDVYQIRKNDSILFPLSVVKEYNKNQATFTAVFAFLLWTIYFVIRLKKK